MSVAAGRPWWQATKTPRQGFILGSVYGVLSLGELVSVFYFGAHVWNAGFAVLWLGLAVLYLASAAALVRRERSGTASGTGLPGR